MSSFSKKRSASLIEDSDASTAVPVQATKKSKKVASAEPTGNDDDGNPFWDLSAKRRVGVSKFKDMTFINIREYYEKDGKVLPGKKGISLSVEQYTALLKAIPGINASLKEEGQVVEDVDIPDAEDAPKVKRERKASRANIDATSDEDED